MNIRNRIIETRIVKPSEVVPNPKNWRTHPQHQRDALRGALAEVGIVAPIIAYYSKRNNGLLTIVDGHARMEEGSDFPCVILDVDDAEADYVLATYDPLTALAQQDALALDNLLREVTSGNAAIQQMLADLAEPVVLPPETLLTDPDAIPETAPTICKRGDLWLLGEHRLLCGDSTETSDVTRVMDGERATLVCTDPPYGVSYASKNKMLNERDNGNRIETEIENDHGDIQDVANDLWKPVFANLYQAMQDGASFYVCMPQGGDQMMMMMMMITESGLSLRHELMWLKNNHVLGRSDYQYKHEPIAYGWKDTASHSWYGGFQTSVLEFNKPHSSKLHPTMKPVELIEKLISNSSLPNQTVLDPFGGSGTTLIACERLHRRCRMIELSEHYCDVIIKRWQDATGKTAVKA